MNIKSSGNKKTNKPDIKPLRSEVFSNFKRNNVGGGLLMIYLIGTINLIGVILLATWFFNTSGNQQETGQGLIQRLSILEEKIEWIGLSFVRSSEDVKKLKVNLIIQF